MIDPKLAMEFWNWTTDSACNISVADAIVINPFESNGILYNSHIVIIELMLIGIFILLFIQVLLQLWMIRGHKQK